MSSIFRLRSNPFFTIFITDWMLFPYPSLNFLATGLVSIVFLCFLAKWKNRFAEIFVSPKISHSFIFFSLNFALICYKKKYCENLRQFSFFLEISLSCLNFTFLAKQNNAKFVFDNIKNT